MDKLTNKQIRTTLREIELYELRGQNSIDCGEHEQAIKEFGNAISYLRVLVENLYADKNQEIRQMSKTLFCRVVYPETFQFEVPDN